MSKPTINLFRKIRAKLSLPEFMKLEEQLVVLSEKELEAFWIILAAGYPAKFAYQNYLNLNEYMRNKNISYDEALRTIYTIYPGLRAGIFVRQKEWFELN